VAVGVHVAARCGIDSEADVARFLEIVFRYFGGFSDADLPAGVVHILESGPSEPKAKLNELQAWAGAAAARSRIQL
jgi:hypothetical protein